MRGAWLHTWFGLGLGYVLMICFFFGSLSVFDRELDRWAIPETRYAPQPMPSFDTMLLPIFQHIRPSAESYATAQGQVEGIGETESERQHDYSTVNRSSPSAVDFDAGL